MRRDTRFPLRQILAIAASALLLASCQAPQQQGAPSAVPAAAPGTPSAAPAPVAAAPAPAAPAAPPPPPETVNFDLAVERAATALFAAAERNPELTASPPRAVIIDPLVDGNTAQQTVASDAMGGKIADLIGKRFTRFAVAPFRRPSLERNPLLLVGTLTAINAASDPKARNDIYRVCLALVDVRAGKVVAKGVGRATEQTVDATPLPYYADSPTWVKDRSADGYIRTCQATRPGDAADALYLETIPAAMAIDEAIRAYHARDFAEANRLYRTAVALPGGEQRRVVNGLYLTSWKLKRVRDAEDAFGKIVVRAFEDKRLGVKFLFRPATTEFVAEPDLRSQYALWTKVIAQRAVDAKACMQVVGHATRTGREDLNDALSLRRADVIRTSLERQAPAMRNKIKAVGAGSRELIVGTGTDDLRDALDRRVEFKVVDC